MQDSGAKKGFLWTDTDRLDPNTNNPDGYMLDPSNKVKINRIFGSTVRTFYKKGLKMIIKPQARSDVVIVMQMVNCHSETEFDFQFKYGYVKMEKLIDYVCMRAKIILMTADDDLGITKNNPGAKSVTDVIKDFRAKLVQEFSTYPPGYSMDPEKLGGTSITKKISNLWLINLMVPFLTQSSFSVNQIMASKDLIDTHPFSPNPTSGFDVFSRKYYIVFKGLEEKRGWLIEHYLDRQASWDIYLNFDTCLIYSSRLTTSKWKIT